MLSLGAALAGRTLGSVVYGRRPWTEPAPVGTVGRHCGGRRPGPGPRPALAGSAARAARRPGGRAGLYAVLLGIAAAHRQAPPRNVGLAAWLARNHLTSGFAPYWEAASVTVDTGGAVTVLP